MFGIGKKNQAVNIDRFDIVSTDLHEFGGLHQIIKDKETGVLYYLANIGNGVGLTPLLGSDGKPIIESVETKTEGIDTSQSHKNSSKPKNSSGFRWED